MVQMPPGIPVATVAIDGGRNAGLLAVQILATHDAELSARMIAFKEKLAETTREKDRRVQEKRQRK
jgi:5-(carboxyamino)imidazole ribonucleotide mutase